MKTINLEPVALIPLYDEAVQLRMPFESEWKSNAIFCFPTTYQTWETKSDARSVAPTTTGVSTVNQRVYDVKGANALEKYAEVMFRITTPSNNRWHGLAPSNPDLAKSLPVKRFFEELTTRLFKHRYRAGTNFIGAQMSGARSVGCYGNGPKYVVRRKPPGSRQSIFRYQELMLADVYALFDDFFDRVGYVRVINMTASQWERKFPETELPKTILSALENAKKGKADERTLYPCLHFVMVNDEPDTARLDHTRFPWCGTYIFKEEKFTVGKPEGYLSCPLIWPRAPLHPGTGYGYAPANRAMPVIRTINAQRKSLLRLAQKSVEPSLLAYDDGALSGIDLRPNGITYGGVDSQGRKLIHELQVGRFDISEKLLEQEIMDLNDAFMISTFKMLLENPNMTATQVLEVAGERAAAVDPSMGRYQDEDLGPLIDREVTLLAQDGLMPEVPPELVEAQGEYEVIYTSPMARLSQAPEVTGFTKLLQITGEHAKMTGSPTAARRLNIDRALPQIAEALSVPSSFLYSDEEMAKQNQAAEARDQTAQLAEAAPALAGVMKASATMQNQMPKAAANQR